MPYFLRKEYLENFPSFSSKRVAKNKGDGYAAVSARRRRRQGYHAGLSRLVSGPGTSNLYRQDTKRRSSNFWYIPFRRRIPILMHLQFLEMFMKSLPKSHRRRSKKVKNKKLHKNKTNEL